MSKKKKSDRPDGPCPEAPAKLLEEIRKANNDVISREVVQKLKAFCDVQTFVFLDGAHAPVLRPNLGFMPSGECEEFMDFDGMIEDLCLKKFVRVKFDGEHFDTSHVAVSVIRPGFRGREGVNLFKLGNN